MKDPVAMEVLHPSGHVQGEGEGLPGVFLRACWRRVPSSGKKPKRVPYNEIPPNSVPCESAGVSMIFEWSDRLNPPQICNYTQLYYEHGPDLLLKCPILKPVLNIGLWQDGEPPHGIRFSFWFPFKANQK